MKLRSILFISYIAVILPLFLLVASFEKKDELYYAKVEAAHNFYIKNMELTFAVGDFFSATKNYLLLSDTGGMQAYRSNWLKQQMKIDEPLKFISNPGFAESDLAAVTAGASSGKTAGDYARQLNKNIGLAREMAANILNDHDLEIQYADDSAKRKELKEEGAKKIKEMNRVRDEIFESFEKLNGIFSRNIDTVKGQNEMNRKYLLYSYALLFSALLIVLLAISHMISSPIKKLVELFRTHGDFSRVGTGSVIAEISLLKKAYNDLMDVLEVSTVSTANLESVVKEKTAELEKKNSELEKTLEDFYMMRLTMQKQMDDGVVEAENEVIKKRLDSLKKAKKNI